MKKNETAAGAVIKQTLIIGCISLVLVGAAQPLYILIGDHTTLYEYSALKFILGSVYGWLLGVGNFAVMAISLMMLTSTTTDRNEARKRAQTAYTGRLVGLLLFAVGGCFIPVFHPVAVLLSLALTQFGIFAYSFLYKMIDAKKNGETPAAPSDEAEEKNGGADNADGGRSGQDEQKEEN